ncbi:MAG TPA: hypothetical protein VFZ56_13890 [Gemmatimonadaceae bacterium]
MHTAILVGFLLALAGGSPPPEKSVDRVYSLIRVNGKPVPGDVEFRSTAGSRHWIRIEESVLRLRRNGTFAASARFYRQLLRDGTRPPRLATQRLLNDATQGRYTIRGDTIELHAAKRRDGSGGTAYGRISGDRLRIRQTLKDGNLRHNVDVELRIDPTIW